MAQPDPKQIQGDVLLGLQKNTERFIFFQIPQDKVATFKKHLGETEFVSTAGAQEKREEIKKCQHGNGPKVVIPLSHTNVAFTFRGLKKLGLSDDDLPVDPPFRAGMKAGAQGLGDTLDKWISDFTSDRIDGVFLVTGDSGYRLQRAVQLLRERYGNSIEVQYEITGQVRPGLEKGHEHFGFLDGVSIPMIEGIGTRLPGQDVVKPEILLTGFGGPVKEPAWTVNGSYLVFRQLEQHVLEFRKFEQDVAKGLASVPATGGTAPPLPNIPDLDPEFVGARLVGRWRSGAPLDITPTKDNPVLGADPQNNNLFNIDNDKLQEKCPFAAHTRKTNPRDGARTKPSSQFDITREGGVKIHLMTRHGIPYGREVTTEEANAQTTQHERGLLFVSYQGTISNGFKFVQEQWSNSPAFPFFNFANIDTPGFDQIIGQKNGAARQTQGIIPGGEQDKNNVIESKQEFVVSRGGEYFFAPSLAGIAKLAGTGGVVEKATQFVNQVAQKV